MTTKKKPKPRRITGVCSTEEYLPEPKLDGALLRLRNDRADFSRVQKGAASLLSNHNEERVLGNLTAATAAGSEVRFSANLRLARESAASTNTYAILTPACGACFQLASGLPSSPSSVDAKAPRCLTRPGY